MLGQRFARERVLAAFVAGVAALLPGRAQPAPAPPVGFTIDRYSALVGRLVDPTRLYKDRTLYYSERGLDPNPDLDRELFDKSGTGWQLKRTHVVVESPKQITRTRQTYSLQRIYDGYKDSLVPRPALAGALRLVVSVYPRTMQLLDNSGVHIFPSKNLPMAAGIATLPAGFTPDPEHRFMVFLLREDSSFDEEPGFSSAAKIAHAIVQLLPHFYNSVARNIVTTRPRVETAAWREAAQFLLELANRSGPNGETPLSRALLAQVGRDLWRADAIERNPSIISSHFFISDDTMKNMDAPIDAAMNTLRETLGQEALFVYDSSAVQPDPATKDPSYFMRFKDPQNRATEYVVSVKPDADGSSWKAEEATPPPGTKEENRPFDRTDQVPHHAAAGAIRRPLLEEVARRKRVERTPTH
jgi:hypothetical protein